MGWLNQSQSKLSIRSKALKLIQEGKSDLEVAIQLNLSANEVLEYRREFLILKNEDDLLSIYPRDQGQDPKSFSTTQTIGV